MTKLVAKTEKRMFKHLVKPLLDEIVKLPTPQVQALFLASKNSQDKGCKGWCALLISGAAYAILSERGIQVELSTINPQPSTK
jgi:hypothetical protein